MSFWGLILSETDLETMVERRPWWRRRWLLWTGSVFLVLVIVGVGLVEWGLRQLQPRLRQKVVDTLSARFHSPVELDRLEISMAKGILVTGGGLRILYLAGPTKPDARPNAPPMLVVDHFEFETGWRELLRPTTRVVSVKVRGVAVRIPPKEQSAEAEPENPKDKKQPVIGLAVDTIECADAKVVIETTNPAKPPLEFAISKVVLKDVGLTKPFNYDATLRNPKPAGDIHSTGHFGPWQKDEPRDTPLDGSYEFTHADLSSIRGIAGILSSTGKFGGTLGEIAVEGSAEVPAFRLDISDHALPLHTEFKAVVDGTTGDTHLDDVRARVGAVGTDSFGRGDAVDIGSAGARCGYACRDGEGPDRRHHDAGDESESHFAARRAGDEGTRRDSTGTGERLAEGTITGDVRHSRCLFKRSEDAAAAGLDE